MKKRFIAMIVQRMSSIRQKCDTRIIVSQYNEKERNLKQLEKRCRTIQHKMRELVYNRMKRIVETNSISKILEQGFMIPLTLDGKVIQSLDNYFGKPIQLYTNDKIVKVVCKNVG